MTLQERKEEFLLNKEYQMKEDEVLKEMLFFNTYKEDFHETEEPSLDLTVTEFDLTDEDLEK